MPLASLIPFRSSRPLVPVLRLTGLIMAGTGFRRGLSLAGQAPLLEKAFGMPRAKAVALAINSPGGSPVQSALIFDRIRRLSKQKNIPVISFVEDVAASGGYWLACAGDEIIVNPASVVGSIGVVSAGFGFDAAIARLGISRRIHSSGDRKVMLDPFTPEDPDDVKHLKKIQRDIHDQFIAMVKHRRGAKLKGGEEEIFSGAFWTGRQALELGLADAEGAMQGVLEDRFGERVQLRLIRPPRSWRGMPFGSLGGSLGGSIGAAMAGAAVDHATEAALEHLARARYGL